MSSKAAAPVPLHPEDDGEYSYEYDEEEEEEEERDGDRSDDEMRRNVRNAVLAGANGRGSAVPVKGMPGRSSSATGSVAGQDSLRRRSVSFAPLDKAGAAPTPASAPSPAAAAVTASRTSLARQVSGGNIAKAAPATEPGTAVPGMKRTASHVSVTSATSQREISPLARQGFAKLRRAFRPSPLDILKAMGMMPSGFRPSTLAAAQAKQGKGTGALLMPDLNDSGLIYANLFLDPRTKTLQEMPATTISVEVAHARSIPVPGTAVILARRLRAALWDQKKWFSNVHTVPAVWTREKEKTWQFPARVNALGPKHAKENQFVVKTNRRDVVLLLELTVLFHKGGKRRGAAPGDKLKGPPPLLDSTMKEQKEMSSGWAIVPLFDDKGEPLDLKSDTITLNGGTPWDTNVPLDPTIDVTKSRSGFGGLRAMASKNMTPTISIKLHKTTRSLNHAAAKLPHDVVVGLADLPLLGYYREVLADDLIKHPSAPMLGASCEPMFSVFPSIYADPDMFAAFQALWEEEAKRFKRKQKNDFDFTKAVFRRAVLYMWPLFHLHDMPRRDLADDAAMQGRFDYIKDWLTRVLETETDNLLRNHTDSLHKPFHISEVTYSPFRHLQIS